MLGSSNNEVFSLNQNTKNKHGWPIMAVYFTIEELLEKTMRDEIIDEVRAIKESLAEAVGFDVRRIFEDIKRSEAQTELEGWHHVQPIDVLPE